MPYAVLLILLLRGVTLDGSLDGIKYYLYPQWEKLLSSDRCTGNKRHQLPDKLSGRVRHILCAWIHGSRTPKGHSGRRHRRYDALFLCSMYHQRALNLYENKIPSDTSHTNTMGELLNKTGPGLVFIVYPEAIATMKGSVFWSILFFLMLITLGLDSTVILGRPERMKIETKLHHKFGGLEAMLTGLCDEYPLVLRRHREIFVGCVILFIYACALPTTTYGGNYIVSLLDTYATATGVLFIVFVESMAVCWFYGANRFSQHVKEMLGHLPGLYWRMCWSYISPLFLFTMFLFAVLRYKPLEWEDYKFPAWSISVGWLLTASSMCFVPGYMIVAFLRTKGTFKQVGSISVPVI
ncbi:hypothetical protein HPB48_012185 [Haemaphysalis longicornis]|uniref:Uncharacterized protein n=1 Tax=Haemaphysalis longicornis TaxID=44386 RepID=A0A9J6GQW8_HAELO|nr:hypothetical protein HPB48_012185 [Haemaphysalis longicornis]